MKEYVWFNVPQEFRQLEHDRIIQEIEEDASRLHSNFESNEQFQ